MKQKTHKKKMVLPEKACLKRHADVCSGIDESVLGGGRDREPELLKGFSLFYARPLHQFCSLSLLAV